MDTDNTNLQHLSFDELYNYIFDINSIYSEDHMDFSDEFDKNLTDTAYEEWDNIIKVDTHISCCRMCSEKLLLIQKLFFTIENWNLTNHDELYLQYIVNAALNNATTKEKDNSIKKRLLDWIDKYNCETDLAVGLILNLKEEGSKLITKGMESIIRSKSPFAFENATVSIPTLGKKVITEKIDTKVIDINNKNSYIKIDNEGKIKIKFTKVIDDKTPIIILLNKNKPEKNNIFLVQKGIKDKEWFLETGNIPNGEYVLIFEPI